MDNKEKEDENIGSFYMGRTRRPPQPQRSLPTGALTAAVLVAFVGVLWYAYPKGQEKYSDMDVPVVKADTSSVKAAPSNPGGMEVRHQDSTVFDSTGKQVSADGAEKLIPSTEEPMNKEDAAATAPEAKKASSLKLNLQAKDGNTEKVVSMEEPRMEGKMPGVEPEAKKPDVKKAAVKKTEEKKPAVQKTEVKKVAVKTPAAVPSSGSVYVQLGAYRDVAAAQKDWERLKKKYSEFLGSLSMKTEKADLPGKGIYYRLQAGTLSSARAKEVCDGIKKTVGGGCIVVK